jgi:hypothetical protein
MFVPFISYSHNYTEHQLLIYLLPTEMLTCVDKNSLGMYLQST